MPRESLYGRDPGTLVFKSSPGDSELQLARNNHHPLHYSPVFKLFVLVAPQVASIFSFYREGSESLTTEQIQGRSKVLSFSLKSLSRSHFLGEPPLRHGMNVISSEQVQVGSSYTVFPEE